MRTTRAWKTVRRVEFCYINPKQMADQDRDCFKHSEFELKNDSPDAVILSMIRRKVERLSRMDGIKYRPFGSPQVIEEKTYQLPDA